MVVLPGFPACVPQNLQLNRNRMETFNLSYDEPLKLDHISKEIGLLRNTRARTWVETRALV